LSIKWIKPIYILITTFLIIACGTLQISVVNNTNAQPTATAFPSATLTAPGPTAPAATLSPEAPTTTLGAPTATFPATPTLTLATQTHQPVKIISTHMLDAFLGWAVGQVNSDLNDHLVFTQDGGKTWQERSPQAAFQGVPASGLAATPFFTSADQAWVVYASRPGETVPTELTVWHTADGGLTWQSGGALDLAGLPAEFAIPSDLGFLADDLHGWIMVHLGVGMSHDYIAVFTTADSGKTWQRVVDSNQTQNIAGPDQSWDLMSCPKTGLAFSDPATAWLSGDCPGLIPNLFLYHSVDGGKTWNQIGLVPPDGQPSDLFSNGNEGCGVPALVYTSPRTLLIDVNCNNYKTYTATAWLYASEDGGQTFTTRLLPAPYGNLHFIDPNLGFMLGTTKEDPTLPAKLFATSDGGRSWTSVTPTNWQGMPDFVDASNGWVPAAHADVTALVFSSNGGKTWSALQPVMVK